MKIFVEFFFSFLLFFVAQTATAKGSTAAKSVRHVKLYGSIEKVTISDTKSIKSALVPKTEKVCDIEIKVPLGSSFNTSDIQQISSCATSLQGKPAKVFIRGRTYLTSKDDSKDARKGVDFILFVESPLFETSKNFTAGAYTADLSLKSLSLWFNTPPFERTNDGVKTAESFSVNMTVDDPGK